MSWSCFHALHRRLAPWLILLLLLAQGLRLHFHGFADHVAQHGHEHAAMLHIDGVSDDPHHDGTESEVSFAKHAILKIKSGYADSVLLTLAVVVLLFALPGSTPWRPARFTRPAPGGDVRTPPPRAPPRQLLPR